MRFQLESNIRLVTKSRTEIIKKEYIILGEVNSKIKYSIVLNMIC
jgi:hypothetical protein